jgi:hypothetical protein
VCHVSVLTVPDCQSIFEIAFLARSTLRTEILKRSATTSAALGVPFALSARSASWISFREARTFHDHKAAKPVCRL